MSAKAGTIQGTQTGVSWTGGWIAAVLLTLLLAVTLFAMTRGSGPADTAPAGARVGVTQQLGGGGPDPRVADTTLPAQQPIMIEDYVCHQCR